MTKSLQVLFLVIALSGCRGTHTPTPEPSALPSIEPSSEPSVLPSGTPSPEPSASPSPIASPDPSLAYQGHPISIRKIVGASAAEIEMIKAGAKLANDMVKNPCFKQWVLAADYTEDNGLSQSQIFDLVYNKPMTVDIDMYTGSWKENYVWKTVGWESVPFDGVVHMNRFFVNTPYMVGDNIIHEDRGHSLEFYHYGTKSTSEPYGMNYAYEGCSQVRMQAKGAPEYRPPGIRLHVRYKDGTRAPHPRKPDHKERTLKVSR